MSVDERHLLYRAESPDLLIVEPLDDMTLIYHRRSGITHMVTAPVPEILEAMGEEVVDIGAIAARLSLQFEIEADASEVIAIVDSRLADMLALGLVERVSKGTA
jgi:PqqD family protein of HPr-rel-A system